MPWKRGTGTSVIPGEAGGNGGVTPARNMPRACTNSVLKTVVARLRWVAMTPFGWLVVPDV